MNATSYAMEYESIVAALQGYLEGCRRGQSELMRSSFHPGASFFGYAGGELRQGTEFLFNWVDGNGQATAIRPTFTSVDILDSIAVVRLEVEGWSGKLAGPGGVRMSDLFTLVKTGDGWKIIQKAFHWHA